MLDILGFFAGAIVIATVFVKSESWLQAGAVAANALFIVYGVMVDLLPVYGLHAVLLAITTFRWFGARYSRRNTVPLVQDNVPLASSPDAGPARKADERSCRGSAAESHDGAGEHGWTLGVSLGRQRRSSGRAVGLRGGHC